MPDPVLENPRLAEERAKTIEANITRPAIEAKLNNLPAESEKENTYLGSGAASAVQAKGEANVAYGPKALEAVTTGGENTAVGWGALKAIKSSGNGTALGTQALGSATAAGNTALGAFAGQHTTTGGNNVFVGQNAGIENVAGASNTYVGNRAGEKANESESKNNVAIGNETLSEGEKLKGTNVAVGVGAGKKNEGEGNVFLGAFAGEADTGSNKLYVANNSVTPLIKGVMSETAATQELAFYGAAPVKRHATVAVPAETTAANTKAIKELIEAVKGIGIIE